MLLIHVGKCGGSNIMQKFKNIHNINIKSIHVSSTNINNKKKIKENNLCLLVRDPITRYLSIFYYWKKLNIKYLNNESIPHKQNVKKYKIFFDYFKNANHLAESLSNENIKIIKNSVHVLNNIIHFKQGFNFYLCDKKTIKNNIKNFKFIIRQEYYKDDFTLFYNFMCSKYNLKNNIEKFIKKNINNTDKFNDEKKLSQLAINNLRKYFIKDYKILEYLSEVKLLPKNYIDSFIK